MLSRFARASGEALNSAAEYSYSVSRVPLQLGQRSREMPLTGLWPYRRLPPRVTSKLATSSPAAPMVFAHLLVIAVCAAVCWSASRALRANLLKCGVFGGMGVIHGLVPALTTEHGRKAASAQLFIDTQFTAIARTPAAWFSLASVVLLALGWSAFESWTGRCTLANQAVGQVVASKRGRGLYMFLFWASIGMTLLGFVVQFISSGATLHEFLASTRLEYRTYDALWPIICGHLLSFGFLPGFIGFFISPRYRMLGIAFTLALAVAMFFIFAKGTRSLPLGLLGSLGVAYVMRFPVTTRRLLLFGAGTAVLGFLAVSLYEVRKVMSHASLEEMVELAASAETYQESLVSDPLNYHEYLVAAMAYIPSQQPYFDGATYRRILLFWMSSSWKNSWKPEDTNVVFAQMLGPSVKVGATVPPSIPGDVYINFWGWWGLPALFFQGMFLAWVNRQMQRNVLWFTIFGANLVRFVLLVLRGQPYDLFAMMLFIIVGAHLLSWFSAYSFVQAQRDVQKITRLLVNQRWARRKAKVNSPIRHAPHFGAGRAAAHPM